MSDTERWTVGRLLQWTADYLKKNGSSSARLDAEVLLAEARSCQRIELYTAFDQEPDEPIRTKFRELVRRRAGGEPVAYLVGRREFYSLSFQVTPAVLIPRPETEFLVMAILDAAREFPAQVSPVRVADVGTGSGAIAVSVAKHAERAALTAIDISPEALTVARQNAETHGVADRIEFLQGDLLAPLPAEAKFEIIASNPPYIAHGESGTMSPETKHEPQSALFAGPKGTEIIERLVGEAASRLESNGWLMFEISPTIEAAARALVEQSGSFHDVKLIKDLAGHPRILTARKR